MGIRVDRSEPPVGAEARGEILGLPGDPEIDVRLPRGRGYAEGAVERERTHRDVGTRAEGEGFDAVVAKQPRGLPERPDLSVVLETGARKQVQVCQDVVEIGACRQGRFIRHKRWRRSGLVSNARVSAGSTTVTSWHWWSWQ